VIAGTGSNSTVEAVSLTAKAHEAGVDGVLQVAPYYNKPSQEGLFNHFSAVAEATDRPIVLYSIPGRCGIEIDVATVERLLAKHPHINVIKEAGGNCDRVAELRLAMGDDLTILSGDDSLTLPFMANGASGVISVASNLVVGDLVTMTQAALRNDYAAARAIHLRYFDFFRAIFLDPNPVPIKEALHRAGIIRSPEVRSPLASISPGTREVLFGEMDRLGL
jgi:4-hydroxy-tetrahydrodipicolinate synthase